MVKSLLEQALLEQRATLLCLRAQLCPLLLPDLPPRLAALLVARLRLLHCSPVVRTHLAPQLRHTRHPGEG